MPYKIIPVNDKVLIEIVHPKDDGQAFKTTASGIIVSKASTEKESVDYLEGTVVDISKKIEKLVTFKRKDKVIFGKYSNQEIQQDGKTFYITSENNIIATVNK